VRQDGEISLFGDATHLQEIVDSLCQQASQPDTLPAASEQVIADVSGSSAQWVCPVRSSWLIKLYTKYNVTKKKYDNIKESTSVKNRANST